MDDKQLAIYGTKTMLQRIIEENDRSRARFILECQPDIFRQTGHQDSWINQFRHVDLWAEKEVVTFIAITGNFKGEGKDKTEEAQNDPSSNTTSLIFNNVQQIIEQAGKEFNGLFITPGLTASSSIETATNFLNHRSPRRKHSLIIYGYSNGGDAAMDLTRTLNDQGVSVKSLITIDATDRLWILNNVTAATNITPNVVTNHNFYQHNPDDCGYVSCSRGNENFADDSQKTTVINKEIKGATHAELESIARDEIIKIIRAVVEGS